MREIKFRAWDKINGRMWYSNEIGESEEEYSFHITSNEGNLEFILIRPHPADSHYTEETKLIKMQFTGLQDRNGVDIYEGDIIQYIKPDGEKFGSPVCVHWVNDFSAFLPMGLFNHVILGNRFENPELLQKGAE